MEDRPEFVKQEGRFFSLFISLFHLTDHYLKMFNLPPGRFQGMGFVT